MFRAWLITCREVDKTESGWARTPTVKQAPTSGTPFASTLTIVSEPPPLGGPGDGLGLALGDADGLALGDADGLADGLALGEADGDALGLADGLALGLADGDGLGLAPAWFITVTDFPLIKSARLIVTVIGPGFR